MMVCLAKIAPPVVRRLDVDMVNLSFWPFAGHVKPDQSVEIIAFVIKAEHKVAMHIRRARWLIELDFRAAPTAL